MRAPLFALALLALWPAAALAEEATLRASPQALGPAITLGDLFENAGAAAKRAVAPSPSPGRTTHLTPQLVAAAAAAGGLSWTPPEGLERIAVTRRGGGGSSALAVSSGGVRRGDIVLLTYETANLRIATRLRALGDANVGDRVLLENIEGDRTVDAVVTGAGIASATLAPSP